ncbi:regulatory iron-sulfur-containing complex subunit RicT [Treponema zioleckii]|uniref:regulatory iron-sulfur-containing complex subunit RicT n=1 Tax=Treponema zioleckii TaxID=331680 RepID=UPI00168A873C|nr:regulatory iron-sulfur-containing complex subunit RicT [Treponema zioleckii]
MSDIFEQDICNDEEDIKNLEDGDYDEDDSSDDSEFVYPDILYYAKLEYSSEIVYVTVPNNMRELTNEDGIIIPTRYGKDLALVLGRCKNPVALKASDIIMVERIASKDDLKRYHDMAVKEENAFKIFKEKVLVHKLDMKLVAVHFLLEETKALFFFSSENRVDFRELVKDLVSVFKMRIELRQIGVRDESRITGGLGVCGRPYCCHTISDKLPPVSIKMAKEQNLSLNSMKISGQCGRLLCCLSYEYNWYAEARKNLPNEGQHIYYDGTNFRITDVNPLTQMIKMLGDDGRLLEIPAKRYQRENGKWKIF